MKLGSSEREHLSDDEDKFARRSALMGETATLGGTWVGTALPGAVDHTARPQITCSYWCFTHPGLNWLMWISYRPNTRRGGGDFAPEAVSAEAGTAAEAQGPHTCQSSLHFRAPLTSPLSQYVARNLHIWGWFEPLSG